MAYGKIDPRLLEFSAGLVRDMAVVMERMSKDMDDLVNIVTQLTRRVEKLEKGLPETNAGQETEK